MDILALPFFSLQGVAFLIWAICSFRAFFQIRAIAAAETGSINPGPFSFLSAMRVWMRDPATRTLRIVWLVAFAAIVVNTALIATRAPLQ